MYNFFWGLSLALFIFISVILILIILVQKGRGGGLASAFGGGGGGGNTAFGAKTGDVLTWATSIIFGIFILLAVVLNLMAKSHNPTNPQQQQQAPQNSKDAPPPIMPG